MPLLYVAKRRSCGTDRVPLEYSIDLSDLRFRQQCVTLCWLVRAEVHRAQHPTQIATTVIEGSGDGAADGARSPVARGQRFPGFVSIRVCEYASRCWESSMPNLGVAAVLAKHVSAGHAARSASTAVQVLASAGAQDGHVVAGAYRDAKAMEIIAGSNEICQLILAEHALSTIPG
jgi:alkylation response protein AidB-like acyl-CoA dehydrogenase